MELAPRVLAEPLVLTLTAATVALLLLVAALAWRDGRTQRPARALAALAVSAAAQLLVGAGIAAAAPRGVHLLLLVLGVPNVALLWWFSLAMLGAHRRGTLRTVSVMTALAVPPAAFALAALGMQVPVLAWIDRIGGMGPALMILHLCYVSLAGRADDLIEPRRRARVGIVLIGVAALTVAIITEEFSDVAIGPFVRTTAVFVGVLTVAFWVLRIDSDALSFRRPADPVVPEVPRVDPRDAALHARLMRAVETDQIYLQPGLSVDALAEHLQAPVYQVRALIHQGLGFHHFAAFLNSHRIAHARRLLGNPLRARDTVLVIALESGFASLPTFNRVFKELEGVPPTEFRQRALSSPPLTS